MVFIRQYRILPQLNVDEIAGISIHLLPAEAEGWLCKIVRQFVSQAALKLY